MNKIITFFVCFSFFFAIFNPIKTYVSGGEALSMLIPPILIFIFDRMYIRPRTYLFLSVLTIIALLGIGGYPYFSSWLPDIVTLAFGYFGLEHYLLEKDQFYAKWVLIITYSTLIGLVAISLPQFIAMPNLTRMMTAAAKDPTIEFDYYWAVNYNTVHLIPTATIPLFANFVSTKKKWLKWLYGISIGLMSTIMLFADATTPLIIMVLIVGVFWIYNNRQSLVVNAMKISVIILVSFVLLNTSIFVSVLQKVQPLFEGSSTFGKIDQINYYAEHGESYGDMDERDRLYNLSIDAIIDNPLFPETNIEHIGLHSHILDHIAAMGLILFIPYALFIYSRFQRPFRYMKQYRFHYILTFFSFLLLAVLKNSFIFTTACFLVPMYLIYLENHQTKINK